MDVGLERQCCARRDRLSEAARQRGSYHRHNPRSRRWRQPGRRFDHGSVPVITRADNARTSSAARRSASSLSPARPFTYSRFCARRLESYKWPSRRRELGTLADCNGHSLRCAAWSSGRRNSASAPEHGAVAAATDRIEDSCAGRRDGLAEKGGSPPRASHRDRMSVPPPPTPVPRRTKSRVARHLLHRVSTGDLPVGHRFSTKWAVSGHSGASVLRREARRATTSATDGADRPASVVRTSAP